MRSSRFVKLKDMGERAAIDAIWKSIGSEGEYDDCTIVPRDEEYELFTTDYIGEKTHFVLEVTPEILGEFIASVNLSDIAAMGGVPDYFLLSAFMPGETESEFLNDVIKGLLRRLETHGAEYLGGDLKEAPHMGFAGFAVGHVERNKILRRKGAKAGNIIAITGPLGKTGAAYILWQKGMMDFDEVLRIAPRVEEGRIIAGHATSGMDTSDGIFSTVEQMQKINALGFMVNIDDVPLHPLAEEVISDGHASVKDILSFGGEYEILYTAPKLLTGYEIGTVTEEVRHYGSRGYEHFSKVLDSS